MKYTFEKAEKSTVKITIDLTAKEWDEAITNAYEKTKSRYSLPGFRKGKVPKHLLEGTYGKGIFYEDAINYAFPKYYGEVLDKEPSIEVVAQPDIDIKKINDKGITMVATVAVKPEVKLGDYKGITFKKVEYNVKDEDVENELKRLRERNSRTVDVTDKPVENGEIAVIDFAGSVDGKEFEGGKAENYELTLGSKSFIPGFEDQIVGMNVGDKKDINVKFPDDYVDELKGKDAVFAITLKGIKKKELPEVTDEFIKDATGLETVDAYKKDVRDRMEKQNAERAERELEDQMIKEISAKSEVEIPDALIERQIDHMVEEMQYRLSYQGLKLEDYLKYMNKTMAEYRKTYEEQAKDIVKSQLVIGQIIENEKLEATEEDVEKRVEEMAKAQNKPAPDVKKNLQAGQLEYFKNEIVINKLFELLKKENTVE